ncbi:MAG TPA: amino acid racemase [Thermoanaerobaculia bacterium]|nr:amino acid racemase [Thermoanaerobaculia bacterium]
MAQHIGIVACSAEGASLCYRTIATEDHSHPEVSMHTHALADYMECIGRDDWDGVGELMLSSAHKLAAAGAEFLICPDNTIHRVLPAIRDRSPLPWLHIAEVVMAEAERRGFRNVGLTGTKYLVESDVYPRSLVRPAAEERDEMNRIIFEELVYGVFEPTAVRYFEDVIARFRDEGCDAVILGCTEIPLIVSDENSALPVLDSTRLLARAAVARAKSA